MTNNPYKTCSLLQDCDVWYIQTALSLCSQQRGRDKINALQFSEGFNETIFLCNSRTQYHTFTPHFSQKYALLPSNNSPFTNWSRESCSVAFFTVTFSEKKTSSCSYLQPNVTKYQKHHELLNIYNSCPEWDHTSQCCTKSQSANYAFQLPNYKNINNSSFRTYDCKYTVSVSHCVFHFQLSLFKHFKHTKNGAEYVTVSTKFTAFIIFTEEWSLTWWAPETRYLILCLYTTTLCNPSMLPIHFAASNYCQTGATIWGLPQPMGKNRICSCVNFFLDQSELCLYSIQKCQLPVVVAKLEKFIVHNKKYANEVSGWSDISVWS